MAIVPTCRGDMVRVAQSSIDQLAAGRMPQADNNSLVRIILNPQCFGVEEIKRAWMVLKNRQPDVETLRQVAKCRILVVKDDAKKMYRGKLREKTADSPKVTVLG